MTFKVYKASDLNKGIEKAIIKDFENLKALKDYQAQEFPNYLLLNFFNYEMQNEVEVHYIPAIIVCDEKYFLND